MKIVLNVLLLLCGLSVLAAVIGVNMIASEPLHHHVVSTLWGLGILTCVLLGLRAELEDD